MLAQELAALGAAGLAPGRGGVAFSGGTALGYAACLWLRTATRVQKELVRGEARDPRGLYDLCRGVDWPVHMRVQQTLAVDASVRDSGITHSQYAAQVVKDAVVDAMREAVGARPSVDLEKPDLPLKLVLKRDTATLYKELAGESLHKRGYHALQVKSPLNEATAAGLLLLAGWKGEGAFVDPMCGSGTLVIEAALIAADRAPGLKRRFAFEGWPDLDRVAWSTLRAEARARSKPGVAATLLGADRHGGAVAIARESAMAAGVADLVRFEQCRAAELAPAVAPTFVITNPPWGQRLGAGEDLVESWRELGKFLHERCKGATAFVLSGDRELTRHLGLRSSQRWAVMNGPIECRLVKYEVAAR